MSAGLFKVCYIILLLFCSNNFLYSQHKKAAKQRSLYYPPASVKDSIDALNDLADTLCLHKDEKGKQLAFVALGLSKQIKYSIGIGDASHSLGLTQFRRNNDSAIYYFKAAQAAYSKEYPGYEKMAFALNNLSRAYDESQKYDSSLFYARAAMAFVQSAGAVAMLKSKWQMYTNGATANAHAGQSRYDSASHYYLKAVTLAEQLGNDKMLEVYFKGLSGIQSQLGNYDKAAEYGKKAVKYSRDDCRGLSIAMANLAAIYSRLKDYVNADKMADSSIKTGQQCNVWNSIGRNYGTLGNSQLQQKNYTAALHYFKTGIRQALLHHNSKASIGSLHRRLGEVYLLMDTLQLAKENFIQALKMAEGDDEMKAAVYLSLSQLAYKEGDAATAYKYIQLYNAFRDTVYTKELIQKVTELNTRYETERKDQQLLLLTKEKALQTALVNEQLHQLAKEKAEKREQQLEIANYELETGRQEQLLRFQELDIENSRIKQGEQQMQIASAATKLQLEQKEKVLAQGKADARRNWLLALLVAGAVSGIIALLFFNRYRLMRKIQEQQALLKQREHISRELHDEIGATLSGIAMYSHLAKEQINKTNSSGIENSLSIIQQNAGEMVNKLNDIVWLISPGNDNLQKLLQRLEDYAVQMAAVKGIRVKSNINGHQSKVLLPAETRRNIYLLFKEAINNAVKYSNASLLEFTITEEVEGITLVFSDNGSGFDLLTAKPGNGISNIKKRAEEIKAVFSYAPTPGKGTIIKLHLPQ